MYHGFTLAFLAIARAQRRVTHLGISMSRVNLTGTDSGGSVWRCVP